MRTLTEKPGCLWAGLYRGSRHETRFAHWTVGPSTYNGPQDSHIPAPVTDVDFSWKYRAGNLCICALKKNIQYMNIKANLGIPAHDRAHQSIRLALDAELDIIMNTTVCQSQTEIQFHIWRTHCWQFFWTIDSGVHSIHLLGSSYALSNAPANPVGSHNLFWESNSIKSVKALLNSVWCSTWHNIMKFLVFHFGGHRIDL